MCSPNKSLVLQAGVQCKKKLMELGVLTFAFRFWPGWFLIPELWNLEYAYNLLKGMSMHMIFFSMVT